jgi:hypothetical protein
MLSSQSNKYRIDDMIHLVPPKACQIIVPEIAFQPFNLSFIYSLCQAIMGGGVFRNDE